MITKLGVDVGGVLTDRVNDGTDTSFLSDNFLQTTEVLDAFAALRELNDRKFHGQIYVVSKCGPAVEKKTLLWLEHHNFYTRTNIRPDQIHFCRERHQKAGICEKLSITQFVDDLLEVLSHLDTVPTRYLFQPRSSDVKRFAQFLPLVHPVHSWSEILKLELS